MKIGMLHPRGWLLLCLWSLLCWVIPVEAAWETYQRAGEAAYSRGDYGTARRMFMAAVRQARRFGPQDPRLDISLHKLTLLRGVRGTAGKAVRRPARLARRPASSGPPRVVRARPVARATLRRPTPAPARVAVRLERLRARRAQSRTELRARRTRPEPRATRQVVPPRPRATRQVVSRRPTRSTPRVAVEIRRRPPPERQRPRVLRPAQPETKPPVLRRPPERRGRATPAPRATTRQEAMRTPRRPQARVLQPPRATLRQAQPAQKPQAVRPSDTRSGRRRR